MHPASGLFGVYNRDESGRYRRDGLDFLYLDNIAWRWRDVGGPEGHGGKWFVQMSNNESATGFTDKWWRWATMVSLDSNEAAEMCETGTKVPLPGHYMMEVYCNANHTDRGPWVSTGEWIAACVKQRTTHLFMLSVTCLAEDEPPPHNFLAEAAAQCGLDAPPDDGSAASKDAWRLLNVDRWAFQWARLNKTNGLDWRERYYQDEPSYGLVQRVTTMPYVITLILLASLFLSVGLLAYELMHAIARWSGWRAARLRFQTRRTSFGGAVMPRVALAMATVVVPLVLVAAREAHVAAFMRDNRDHPTCFASGYNLVLNMFNPYVGAKIVPQSASADLMYECTVSVGCTQKAFQAPITPGFLSARDKTPSEWLSALRDAFGDNAMRQDARFSYFSLVGPTANSWLVNPIPEGRRFLDTSALPEDVLLWSLLGPWHPHKTIQLCDPEYRYGTLAIAVALVRGLAWLSMRYVVTVEFARNTHKPGGAKVFGLHVGSRILMLPMLLEQAMLLALCLIARNSMYRLPDGSEYHVDNKAVIIPALTMFDVAYQGFIVRLVSQLFVTIMTGDRITSPSPLEGMIIFFTLCIFLYHIILGADMGVWGSMSETGQGRDGNQPDFDWVREDSGHRSKKDGLQSMLSLLPKFASERWDLASLDWPLDLLLALQLLFASLSASVDHVVVSQMTTLPIARKNAGSSRSSSSSSSKVSAEPEKTPLAGFVLWPKNHEDELKKRGLHEVFTLQIKDLGGPNWAKEARGNDPKSLERGRKRLEKFEKEWILVLAAIGRSDVDKSLKDIQFGEETLKALPVPSESLVLTSHRWEDVVKIDMYTGPAPPPENTQTENTQTETQTETQTQTEIPPENTQTENTKTLLKANGGASWTVHVPTSVLDYLDVHKGTEAEPPTKYVWIDALSHLNMPPMVPVTVAAMRDLYGSEATVDLCWLAYDFESNENGKTSFKSKVDKGAEEGGGGEGGGKGGGDGGGGEGGDKGYTQFDEAYSRGWIFQESAFTNLFEDRLKQMLTVKSDDDDRTKKERKRRACLLAARRPFSSLKVAETIIEPTRKLGKKRRDFALSGHSSQLDETFTKVGNTLTEIKEEGEPEQALRDFADRQPIDLKEPLLCAQMIRAHLQLKFTKECDRDLAVGGCLSLTPADKSRVETAKEVLLGADDAPNEFKGVKQMWEDLWTTNVELAQTGAAVMLVCWHTLLTTPSITEKFALEATAAGVEASVSGKMSGYVERLLARAQGAATLRSSGPSAAGQSTSDQSAARRPMWVAELVFDHMAWLGKVPRDANKQYCMLAGCPTQVEWDDESDPGSVTITTTATPPLSFDDGSHVSNVLAALQGYNPRPTHPRMTQQLKNGGSNFLLCVRLPGSLRNATAVSFSQHTTARPWSRRTMAGLGVGGKKAPAVVLRKMPWHNIPERAAAQSEWEYKLKIVEALGLILDHGRPVISQIVPESAAEFVGLLKAEDEIIEINDKSMIDVSPKLSLIGLLSDHWKPELEGLAQIIGEDRIAIRVRRSQGGDGGGSEERRLRGAR